VSFVTLDTVLPRYAPVCNLSKTVEPCAFCWKNFVEKVWCETIYVTNMATSLCYI